MLFPDCERVVYRNNSLQQVICQLRFPSILRIDSRLPDQFQERIRDFYPLFRERSELANQIPQQIINLFPTQMKETLPSGKKTYEFVSEDEVWAITLTRDSIALTSTDYTRWFEFKNNLAPAFQALLELYSPAFFSRIGLRYQNIIQRSKLGLSDIPWSDLIQSYIAGPLSNEIVRDSIASAFQTFELNLSDERKAAARIQHGLVERAEDGEQCYLIDSDLFTEERTEANHALETLDGFNRTGTRLFRWCITPRLHEAMGPVPITADPR